MLLLAATTLEKLKAVPTKFWINLGLGLAVVLGTVIIFRYAAKMNKLVLGLIVFLFVAVVGMQWVYERNEPKFMTPYINKIAPFFPSKI